MIIFFFWVFFIPNINLINNKTRKKIRNTKKTHSAGWSWEEFWASFEALIGSIKKKYEFNFIVDIASLQLYKTWSNLVMFSLPKNALKLYQKSALKIK